MTRLALTLPVGTMAPPVVTGSLDLARRFIGRGYDEIWLAEVASAESYALVGALSQVVPGTRIGTGILPVSTRSPLVHAMGAATAAELTGGRFALGLGISSETIVRDWAGQPFDKPMARMRGLVRSLRQALAGEKTQVDGPVSSRGLRLPQRHEVPILLGALNDGMLRLAGEIGDGLVLNMVHESVIPRVVGVAREGAVAAGRDPAKLEVVVRLHVAIAPSVEEGRAIARRAFGPYLATEGYGRFFRSLGYESQIDALRAAFAAGDRAGVAAAMIDPIADAVGVVGPIDYVCARIDEYRRAGVDVIAIHPMAVTHDDVASTYEQVARGCTGFA